MVHQTTLEDLNRDLLNGFKDLSKALQELHNNCSDLVEHASAFKQRVQTLLEKLENLTPDEREQLEEFLEKKSSEGHGSGL